ncbi:HlyD family secretion protein [Pseudoalteromonas tunicata]|jgi:HlyD family secretion protein|uniref:Multidrug resistance efflux pump n=1 Tax=Pseudoalteromonas tunicata D2 TaxID=87626 RepID=A4CEC8_9GAMM|nr:HlyD family efflux transporter periplasmic adaptor subunit [Pseudoalteromonas tunicata]ATC93022.1 hypothetical protein PTUN_a0194 [Pseudoalteromonas tunicata]AXT32106.1 HlyD family efflux transporter periplasmic adaptor subunit [Pseudoalteromonas tunicata]EAR26940.1 multidrug resistance efflux pump [Pseudoalteromonas tunicata D2]MDP4982740.1 HlyD family efflux transporter periplasmic adaptor subunit [Pseudoalteromonas tunicata]MDP5213657.1 HlyD family efflux transporter periplasmic adaptor 
MIKPILLLTGLVFLTACQETVLEKAPVTASKNQVLASGELKSAESHLIAPPSIRRMWQYPIKFMVPENSQVKAGQVVIKFDDKQIQDSLIDKQGELERAQKSLENLQQQEQKTEQELILAVAEKQMQFDKTKRKAEIIDQSRSENDRKKAQIDFTIAQNDLFLAKQKLTFQLETRELNLKMSQGKVARLQNEVADLEADVEKLKVKAPIDGVVIYQTNYEGEKSSVGESVQFGQAVLAVAVLDQMHVLAQIDEPDSGKIKIGQAVKVTLDGSSAQVVNGKIQSLGGVFREKSWQDKRRIIDAMISLDTVDTAVMRPGMSARIEVDIATPVIAAKTEERTL